MFSCLKRIKLNKERGISLFELLVVTSIIIILSSIVYVNYRSGERKLALERSTYKLSQDLRRAQSMSGLRESSCCPGDVCPEDYNKSTGIFFDIDKPKQYVMFADCDGGKSYDAGDTILETMELEREVEIGWLSNNLLSIVFEPPDPSSTEGTITLRLERDTAETKSINVSKTGLIDID